MATSGPAAFWGNVFRRALGKPTDALEWAETVSGCLFVFVLVWYALGRDKAMEELTVTALTILSAFVVGGFFFLLRVGKVVYQHQQALEEQSAASLSMTVYNHQTTYPKVFANIEQTGQLHLLELVVTNRTPRPVSLQFWLRLSVPNKTIKRRLDVCDVQLLRQFLPPEAIGQCIQRTLEVGPERSSDPILLAFLVLPQDEFATETSSDAELEVYDKISGSRQRHSIWDLWEVT